jgi:hypothetical protein
MDDSCWVTCFMRVELNLAFTESMAEEEREREREVQGKNLWVDSKDGKSLGNLEGPGFVKRGDF